MHGAVSSTGRVGTQVVQRPLVQRAGRIILNVFHPRLRPHPLAARIAAMPNTKSTPSLFDVAPPAANGHLEIKTLEAWLWHAACAIRGALDAPKFKDYTLPLIFVKRLSDVCDDEMARLAEESGIEKAARALVKKDHSLVRFYITTGALYKP